MINYICWHVLLMQSAQAAAQAAEALSSLWEEACAAWQQPEDARSDVLALAEAKPEPHRNPVGDWMNEL